jgi:hypothetical protein
VRPFAQGVIINLRNLERGDNAVALLYGLDSRTYFVDDSHILVTEDISALKVYDLLVVEVQITATDSGTCDPDNDVCGFGGSWDRSFLHTDI